MTGKKFKEFAAKLSDDCEVEVLTRMYTEKWDVDFKLRAIQYPKQETEVPNDSN